MDRLARQGRRFTSFHVAQAVCSASRAALLTGCYPNRIGIHGALGPNAKVGISSNETTIAEMLKKRGYATGMAGKWHLGHHKQFLPVHHGFDEYLGLPYSNDMWPHHPEAKPGTYPPLPLIKDDGVSDPDVSAEDQVGLTTLYTQRAVDFIQRKKDGPFFFYLAYAMPHVPLFVSDKYAGKSGRGLYADVIMEIDWSVGEVMKALDKAGVAKNTLVIFASDNGPWLSYGNHAGSPGPLREGKGTSWEGGVRVPGIVRWPGHVPAGTTSDAFWMTIDVLPTLAAITGAELPKQTIDGRNILPLLEAKGTSENPHDGYAIYYEV
ncbi:MAG TPA: sulfatase, partial [Verrucomicrobiae bacterium]